MLHLTKFWNPWQAPGKPLHIKLSSSYVTPAPTDLRNAKLSHRARPRRLEKDGLQAARPLAFLLPVDFEPIELQNVPKCSRNSGFS
jgi:hypothetical protein